MTPAVFMLLLVAVTASVIVVIVYKDKIQQKRRELKANRIAKREVPPEDRFDDQLRKYLERHRYGER
jgi:hypothetical protein